MEPGVEQSGEQAHPPATAACRWLPLPQKAHTFPLRAPVSACSIRSKVLISDYRTARHHRRAPQSHPTLYIDLEADSGDIS